MTAGTSTIALMYHGLGDPPGPAVDPHYSVDMTRFSDQLALCRRFGGATVSARDWLAGKGGVIITFDDGDESNYRLAFPALAESKSSADFFVTPAQVGTPGYCTWAELREMSDAGMSIQSHGYTHAHYLTDLSPAQLRDELGRARQEIEDKVGTPVTLLAPAGGRMPAGLLATARACGYTHVLSSRPGKVRPHQHEICRLAVTARLALATLDGWLRGGRALLRAQVRYAALDFAKRLLGDANYESVRKRLLGTALA